MAGFFGLTGFLKYVVNAGLFYGASRFLEHGLQEGQTYRDDQIRNTVSSELPVGMAFGTVRAAGNKMRISKLVIIGGDAWRYLDIGLCKGVAEGIVQLEANDNLWEDIQDDSNTRHSYTFYPGDMLQQADFRFADLGKVQAYRGVCHLAMSLRQNSQVAGDPNIVAVYKGMKLPPLAGGADVWTNNPAVIAHYIETVLEGRSDIDTAEFQVLEAYCDAVPAGQTKPRFSFDYIFDERTTLNDIKKKVWESFNGRVIRSHGEYKPVWECDKNYGDGSCTSQVHGSLKSKFRDNTMSATDNTYNKMVLLWTTGNNAGEQLAIDDYVGADKEFQFAEDFTNDIAVTDEYELVACAAITPDDIVAEDGKDTFWYGRVEPPNMFRVHYIDEDRRWKKDSVPWKDEASIAVNGELIDERQDWWISNSEVARRRVQFLADKSIAMDYLVELTGFPWLAKLEPFDVVAVTHPDASFTLKRFQVTEIEPDELGRPKLKLEAYDSNIYHDREATTQTGYNPEPESPSFVIPVVGIDLTEGVEVDGGVPIPYILIQFYRPDNPYWDHVEVWTSRDAEATWTYCTNAVDGVTGYRLLATEGHFYGGDTVYIKLLSVHQGEPPAKELLADAESTSIELVTLDPTQGPGMTIGAYTTEVVAANQTTLQLSRVDDLAGFDAAGGAANVHDPVAGTRDLFTYTGRVDATLTLTGIPGGGAAASLLAHANMGLPVVPTDVHHTEHSGATGETEFFGDRGDGTVELLATIGIKTEGADQVIGFFGTLNSSHIGVLGLSETNAGVHGYSKSDIGGEFGTQSGYALVTYGGNVGLGTHTPNELVTVEGRISLKETTAPGNTAAYGKLWVSSVDNLLYFMDDLGNSYDLTVAAAAGGWWSKAGVVVYYTGGPVAIGVNDCPHGGIGVAELAIDEATDVAIQLTESTDDYPVIGIYGRGHGDMHSILFDCYWDGTDPRSSDAGSNFGLIKTAVDTINLSYASGYAQGNVITWAVALSVDTSGNVTIPNGNLVVSSDAIHDSAGAWITSDGAGATAYLGTESHTFGSGNRLIIFDLSSVTANIGTNIRMKSAHGNDGCVFDMYTFENSNSRRSLIRMFASDTDVMDTLTVTNSGKDIGLIQWYGVDTGSNWSLGARIFVECDANATATETPMSMALETYNASGINTDQFKLHSAGHVSIANGIDLDGTTFKIAFIEHTVTAGEATAGQLEELWTDGDADDLLWIGVAMKDIGTADFFGDNFGAPPVAGDGMAVMWNAGDQMVDVFEGTRGWAENDVVKITIIYKP